MSPPQSQPSSDSRVFTYWIDAHDRITKVNDDWLAFAQENDAPELSRAAVLNRSLYEFLEGATVQTIYELILRRVRAAQVPLRVPFRCDAPDRRRFMEMEVTPLPQGRMRLACRVERIEMRPAIAWPRSGTDPSRLVSMCSWCKRVQAEGNQWVEIEEAIELFFEDAEGTLPEVSHGICPGCEAEWLRELGL